MGILNKEALGCALEKFSESFYLATSSVETGIRLKDYNY